MTNIRIRTDQQRSRNFRKALRGAAIIGAGCLVGFGTSSLVKSNLQENRYERVQALIETAEIDKADAMIKQYARDNALSTKSIVELRQQHTRASSEIERRTQRTKRTDALCAAYGANDLPSIARITAEIENDDKILQKTLADLERRCSPLREEDLIANIDLVIGEGRIALIEEFLAQYPNSAHIAQLRDDAASTYLSIGRSYFREHVAPREVVGYLGRFHRFIVTQRPGIDTDRLSELVREGHAYVQSDVPAESPGISKTPLQTPAEATPGIKEIATVMAKEPDMDPAVYARWQQAIGQRKTVPEKLRTIPSPSLRAEIVQHLDAIEYAASRDR